MITKLALAIGWVLAIGLFALGILVTINLYFSLAKWMMGKK